MKFSMLQPQFERLIVTASRAVSTRSSLPVLRNLLLELENGVLRVTGSDLALTIRVHGECEEAGWESGAVTLPSDTLYALVSKLDRRQAVEFELDTTNTAVWVRSGKSRMSIRGIPASEYPDLPSVRDEGKRSLRLDSKVFAAAVRKTVYAAASDDTRPELTGLVMDFSAGGMVFIATDSRRFSRFQASENPEPELTIAIPAANMREIERIFSNREEPVQIDVGGNGLGGTLVSFSGTDTVVSSQILNNAHRVAGLDQLLKQAPTELDVDSASIRLALERAQVFGQDSRYFCQVSVGPEGIAVKSKSKERGNYDDLVEAIAEFRGVSVEFGENLVYFLNAIAAFSESEVLHLKIHTGGVLVITSATEPALMAAISPMVRDNG